MDTAGRQHTRGLEGAMQARITNPEDARHKRASVGRRSSDAIGAAENQASHRSANESIGVVEGESAVSAGAGMVTLMRQRSSASPKRYLFAPIPVG